MRKKVVLFLAVFAMVLYAGLAWSEHSREGGEEGSSYEGMEKGGMKEEGRMGMMGRRGHADFMREFISELGLNEEQTKKATQLKFRYMKDTARIESDIKVAGIELKELLMEGTVNLERVKQKINEIAGLKAKLKFYRVEKLEEFKKLLDEKQLKKMKELFTEGMGPGMMMGPGMRGTGHEW